MGHFAEQRRRKRDLRFDAELGRDQLGGMHERVALAIREIDGLVHHSPVGERLDAARDPVYAVVDVGEVERLFLSEHGHGLVAHHRVDEERQHADHPSQVVVVAAVDIREAEYRVIDAPDATVVAEVELGGEFGGTIRRIRFRRRC